MRFAKLSSRTSWAIAAGLLVLVSALIASQNVVHGQRGNAYDADDDVVAAATAATYYTQPQYATITATTNTVNLTMVPVVTASGTVYRDITIQLAVDSKGNITYAATKPTVTTSSTIQTSTFRAGNYAGPTTVLSSNALIAVASPGVISGGATAWTLTTRTGAAGCTYPTSATWYVLSPTSTNHPLYARLKNAGLTSTAYSYGVIGSSTGCYSAWPTNGLIGLSQSGNTLSITSFSYNSTDYKTSKDQITYTLK